MRVILDNLEKLSRPDINALLHELSFQVYLFIFFCYPKFDMMRNAESLTICLLKGGNSLDKLGCFEFMLIELKSDHTCLISTFPPLNCGYITKKKWPKTTNRSKAKSEILQDVVDIRET